MAVRSSLTEKQLHERDSKRDIGAELLPTQPLAWFVKSIELKQ